MCKRIRQSRLHYISAQQGEKMNQFCENRSIGVHKMTVVDETYDGGKMEYKTQYGQMRQENMNLGTEGRPG
jgi:hypothetical protein